MASGRGAVWLARLTGGQEVAGSSPVAPTFLNFWPFGKNAERLSLCNTDQYSYSWDGDIFLKLGKPAIAAAVQNETSVVFFVLTATIHQTPPAEQNKSAKEK